MKNKKAFNGQSAELKFPAKKRKNEAFGGESVVEFKNKKKKGKK